MIFKKDSGKIFVLILTGLFFSLMGSSGLEAKIATKHFGSKNLVKKIIVNKNSSAAEELTLKLDLSPQILQLSIPKDSILDAGNSKSETRIYPTLKGLLKRNSFVSAAILAIKAKQFDDGLYAAVEIASQEGMTGFLGKQKLLRKIHEALNKMQNTGIGLYPKAFISAAAQLGGQNFMDEPAVKNKADSIRFDFLKDPLKSKPLGFYTWNHELAQIFQQDRLLQKKLGVEPASILAKAINLSGPEALNFYRKYMELVEKMTNPFIKSDLRPLFKTNISVKKTVKFAFLPPSRSFETDLVNKLYGEKAGFKPIPEGFNLAEKLIEEIQAGRIDMTPKANSGWYDYQAFSLEPLILTDKFTEAKKIKFTKEYRKELKEFFKSFLALTRETHIKQLECPIVGCAMFPEPRKNTITLSPDLTLEPLASFYLRRARSYNFIHHVLLNAFGEENLKKMHRLAAEGPVEKNLSQELAEMEGLFFGAALQAAAEIGCTLKLTPLDGSGRDEKSDLAFARNWLRHASEDPDIEKDNRMMVPVLYDIGRNRIKVWVFLGFEKKPFSAAFLSPPKVTVFNNKSKKLDPSQYELNYEEQIETLVYPVFAEIYVNQLLNRNEFRRLCDRYQTRSKILKALENMGGNQPLLPSSQDDPFNKKI